MSAPELKDVRNRLLRDLAEAAELVRRDRNDAEDAEQVSIIPDEGDMANMSHNRAITNILIDARAHRLKSIEEAIERIDRGEYGSCKRCEKDIHVKRLVAMPWAELCLQCQTELEHAASACRIYEFARFDPEESNDSLCA